jgi:RNase H-like domain found in reverse transcriptase/Reverse transcriptase (RNA-dependent DNA polymerase)/Integrase core domain
MDLPTGEAKSPQKPLKSILIKGNMERPIQGPSTPLRMFEDPTMEIMQFRPKHNVIPNLHPVLPYVTLTIGLPYNRGPQFQSHGTRVRCMIDTGCAKTSIDKEVYDFLMKNFNNKCHDITKVPVQVVGCTKETKMIEGTCKIRLHFQRKPDVYRDVIAMVVENLSEDVLIGYDLVSSLWTQALTKNFWVVRGQHQGPDIQIPIQKDYMEIIPCTVARVQQNVLKIANAATNIINSRIRILEKDDRISHREQYLRSQFPDYVREVTTYHVNTREEQTRENAQPQVLEHKIKDKEMNAQEINLERDDFVTKGFYQPSITQYIEDRSAVTELGLEDDRPLTDTEFIGLFDIAHIPTKERQFAQEIFLEFRTAFSTHKYDIGKTDIIEMDIQLNSNEPKMQKYVPIPVNVKDKVKEILDQLLKYGIIRVCHEPSPYCSNILVVKKKDGKTIRLLFDGRLLNYDTKRLPMALISKPEILAHLINKTHLTSLDFADAFFHIPLSKETQPYTAFYSHTHGLRMCFTRAPQGLRNSPLYLKLLLDRIFYDMTDTVLFYADDLLIASEGSLVDHLKILGEVLSRLSRANLKLRPQKLLIAKDTIEFLGMIFRKGRISIPEAKLEAFRKLPSPTTPKKTKSLICCLSFYRQFCPRFATLSHKLMEISNVHPKTFKWTNEHEELLRTLIKEICQNASLYLPNPAKTFYVQTDASQYCAAGRIFQKNDKGEEQIVAAVSRTFTKTERAYSIFKKEILALMYTLKTMDYFLRYATKLIIYVDAKSIIYLRLAKESSGILLRFSLELSKYNAEVYHIPGEQNQVSDVLSRQHPRIDNIINDVENNATLTEKDSIRLVQRLTLPDFKLTQEETRYILEGQSPPAVGKTKNNKSKASEGKRLIKNVPDTLTTKKLNLPKTSKYRPGMNLPINVSSRSPVKEEDSQRKRKRTTPQGESTSNEGTTTDTEDSDTTYLTARDTTDPYRMPEDTDNYQIDSLDEWVTDDNFGEISTPEERSDIDTHSDAESTQSQHEDSENELRAEMQIEEQIPQRSQTREGLRPHPQKRVHFEIEGREDSEPETIPPTQPQDTTTTSRRAKKLPRREIPDDKDLPTEASPTDEYQFNEENDTRTGRQENNTSEEDEDYEIFTQIPPTQPERQTQPTQDSEGEEEITEEQQVEVINYTDVTTSAHIITEGILTINTFIEAQKNDPMCTHIKETQIGHNNKYVIIDEILFRNTPTNQKPVLPKSLYEPMIFTKHFTIYGAHASMTRILRDTKHRYYIPDEEFHKKLREITTNCYICQFYNTNCPAEAIKQLPAVNAPRLSWSIDMITDTPTSEKGNTQILLCVDDFTSYVVCMAVASATAENILHALKTQLFAQFGTPKLIRSDQQATFYTSTKFATELTRLRIQLTATAVASPFSNSRAESQIKNIKHMMRKFLFQEHNIEQWDEILPIITCAYNRSVGIYGHSAEEIMFGHQIPSAVDILSFNNRNLTKREFVTTIFRKAEEIRRLGQKRMDAKAQLNRSFKNKTKTLKEFQIGALVLHKQLQASTGTASKYKPLFTGPYTILKINKDRCTAILEHLKTNKLIKAHFTNMQYLHYSPSINKLSDEFDKEFYEMLQDKYSIPNYSEANTKHPNNQQQPNSDDDFEPQPSTSNMARRASQSQQSNK